MQYDVKLNRARVHMLSAHPFFGLLIMYMQTKVDEKFPTMGTDGASLVVNPKFIDSLSANELNWCMIHEVLHVALGHLWRGKGKDKMLFNIACDYAIHSAMIDEMKVEQQYGLNMKRPNGTLYDAKYAGKSAEEIYYELLAEMPDKNACIGIEPQNHGGWNNDSFGADSESAADGKTEWEERIISATASMKNCGKLPGALERMIRRFTRPVKDWRSLLHQYMTPCPNDYGWQPPDARFQDSMFVLPALTDENIDKIDNVAIWIDTSGSMSSDEIEKVFSEAVGIVEQSGGKMSGWIGFFDHKAYELTAFEDTEELKKAKAEGGGGTCFHAPFEKTFQSLAPYEITCLIVMTDGMCDYPKKSISRGVPTLWLLTDVNIADNMLPPWGEYTFLRA